MFPTPFYRLLISALILLQIVGCSDVPPEHIQVSEKPAASISIAQTETTASKISTRVRVDIDNLIALADAQIPAKHTDADRKKICKKVLGIKICGTAKWQYSVQRQGPPTVSGSGSQLQFTMPMRFFGNAGLSGDVAKVLNFDKLDFDGALNAILDLDIDLTEQWCPRIISQADYEWTKPPKLQWASRFDFDIQDQLDKALREQLSTLQGKVDQAIDCHEIRQQLDQHWQAQSIAVQLPEMGQMYLNIDPTGFAFSGLQIQQEKIGLAFALDAFTSLDPNPIIQTEKTLPPLVKTAYQPGKTQFDLTIRAGYEQLTSLVAAQVVGQTFNEQSPLGEIAVIIDSLDISSSADGLVLKTGFEAQLPGRKNKTPGTVYLQATPVLDAFSNTVKLKDIALTNILDSTVWNALVSVFKKQIIKQIETSAVLPLDTRITELEQQIIQQLNDPSKTEGLIIDADYLSIKLLQIVPENQALAMIVRAESEIDIELPASTMIKSQ